MRQHRSSSAYEVVFVAMLGILLSPTTSSAKPPAFIRSVYAVRHSAYSLDGSLPVDMAVKVADGYLLSTIDGMGHIGEDMMANPHVVVMHGTERYAGEYVDFDPPTGLALIHADVPGEPLRFDTSTTIDRDAWVVGVEDDQMLGKDFPVQAIDVASAACVHLSEYQMNSCTVSSKLLPLTCIIAQNGKLQTLLSFGRKPNTRAETTAIGPTADRARSFLVRYFRSMGSSIHPIPTF